MADPDDKEEAETPKARKAAKKALPEAEPRPELPTVAAVKKARKAELQAWLEDLGLSTEGLVADLRERLTEYIEAHPAAAEAPAEKPAEEEAPAKAAPERKRKPRPKAKGEEAEEEPEEEEGEAAYRPKLKPALAEAQRRALAIRSQMSHHRPEFRRQEWFRYKRLGLRWRRPQGGQSALRRHFGYRINVVSVGYRSPRLSRGLHPSGFAEVLVHNVRELEGVDAKRQAVRVAHGVGFRKRVEIQEEADKRKIRVLNPVEVEE